MNRRGALELSITAIVVLIIAITVLGLGIGFIKKQFGAGTELVDISFSKIKQDLKEQMKESGELLTFSFPEKVTKGTPQNIQVGVLNTLRNKDDQDPKKDSVCFRVEVKCIKPFTPNADCIDGISGPVVVGGWDSFSPEISNLPPEQNWFKRLNGEFDIRNYEGDVYEGVLLVKGIKSDSYSMEINVYNSPGPSKCEEKDFTTEQVPYASKSFVLNVV